MPEPVSPIELSSRVQAVLLEAGQLDWHLPVVVGFSGGPDSLCLLRVMAGLGWQVIAAHFDHHLRAESSEDVNRARLLAQEAGAKFLAGEGNVAEYARRERMSIEEAARSMRYRFLFDCVNQNGAQALAVGHTADDQVETVLMHLLRGAGLSGLKGMLPVSKQKSLGVDIPLVRPLLHVWRKETEQYCREHGLQPILDASNADPQFYRNRLRHELIPFLESYNPAVRAVVARTADVLAGDLAVVEDAIDAAWGDCKLEEGPGFQTFDWKLLRALPGGLLRGLLRRAVGNLRPGLRDIDLEDVQRAAQFVSKPPRSRAIDLVAGLRLFIEEERLYIEEKGKASLPDQWPQLLGQEPVSLSVPGQVELRNGWSIRAETMRQPDWRTIEQSGENEAWLDDAELPDRLSVRCAKAGDVFQPLGLGGRSQKLSDLWINAKVPRRARAGWPLVWAGEQVVWVAGLRVGHAFRLREGSASSHVIHLMLKK
jgi:tRNA(Ile)-lysidine synthase